jgi:hypothetical protein
VRGCGARFTTFERVQLREITVIKNGENGARREPFDRAKIEQSVALATRKRGIAQERLDQLVSGVQRQIETLGESEVPSQTIGEMVMDGCAGWTAWPISASPASIAIFRSQGFRGFRQQRARRYPRLKARDHGGGAIAGLPLLLMVNTRQAPLSALKRAIPTSSLETPTAVKLPAAPRQ